jgi:tryptophan-rich sensory protein
LLVAVAGGVLTKLTPWYYGLRFPSWKPPDWLFGPAWTVILTLACASSVIAWDNAHDVAERRVIVGLFTLNGVLNAFWSLLYFRLQRPDWALAEVILLQMVNFTIAWRVYEISPTASLCMAPYIVWVAFAGFLNIFIVRLNGPFGKRYRPSTPQEQI